MEEIFLNSLTNFGFPAMLSLILLTKGFSALDKLTNSVNELTKTVERFSAEKFNGVIERLDRIEKKLGS